MYTSEDDFSDEETLPLQFKKKNPLLSDTASLTKSQPGPSKNLIARLGKLDLVGATPAKPENNGK